MDREEYDIVFMNYQMPDTDGFGATGDFDEELSSNGKVVNITRPGSQKTAVLEARFLYI